jgi:inner membrane protein
MKLRTHAACGILLATLISPEVSFVLICWAVVWSVISDLDHYIPTVRHRGITHSLAFALFSGALVFAVGKTPLNYAILASLSVVMHLLLDSLTPSGVPLWMPFSGKRVRFPIVGGHIRSDNWIVNVGIQIVAVLAICFILF